MRESKDKHVFVEFYADWCHYCFIFKDDFNRIYDFFLDNYGDEKVAIFKVNGQSSQDAIRMIGIPYYPYFIYYPPGSQGVVKARYNYD